MRRSDTAVEPISPRAAMGGARTSTSFVEDTDTSQRADHESRWQWLKRTLTSGGPGQCVFAITNACNASCGFCNFALDVQPPERWHHVPLEGAKRAIDVLAGLFVRYLIVSGGEPTLHPDLEEIVRHTAKRGMTVLLVTNGSRLTPDRCRALKDAGVTSMIVSIDAATVAVHEENRKLPGVAEKIRRANEALDELGIQSTASVTVSRLVDDYDALADFLRSLGFRSVTFSYPLTDLPSSFLGHRQSELVALAPEELDRHLEAIKKLKQSFPVVNPTAGLEEMQRFLHGETQRFECLGGYRYFYLDWELLVWRCHSWSEPMCSIFELDERRYVRDGCTRCMVDCYRDSSVMQHVAMNVTDALNDARRGHLISAARRLARRSNVESVRAALETQRWIRDL
jgi:MoaA/NifB/PqqE/SkfB family radical SAM enzyme